MQTSRSWTQRREGKHIKYRYGSRRCKRKTNTTHQQHQGFTLIHKMDAHKHHCLVCLHTPQCSSINANPHNLPTKLSPTKGHTHNLPTKLSPLHFNSTKLPTKLLPINDISTTQMPLLNTTIHITLIKLPPRSTSTIQKCSKHNNIAIAIHTTQNHTHKGKQNHLHLSPSKRTPPKTPKMQPHTIYKLTYEKIPPPTHASLHSCMLAPPISNTHKNPCKKHQSTLRTKNTQSNRLLPTIDTTLKPQRAHTLISNNLPSPSRQITRIPRSSHEYHHPRLTNH